MKCLILLACVVSCALSARIGRILGGEDSAIGAWPWQASIEFDNSHNCAAVLIGPRRLLTAAHCLATDPSYYRVVLGMHDRTSRNEGDPTTYTVESLSCHPGFVNNPLLGFPNDIALITLTEDANTGSEFIESISMADPADGDFSDYNDCYITGWGRTSAISPLSNILQQAKINVITEVACQNEWTEDLIFEGHVCVADTGKGACSGDSGGPLVCRMSSSDNYTLVGVSSWGLVGCDGIRPTVYTRISYFRDWINETIHTTIRK